MTHHRLFIGDVRDCLAKLPDQSVHCVVTSPPYYGLRDYKISRQIGLEPTLAEYLASLAIVFAEVWRVLRSDGTCFINLGDSYASAWPAPNTRRNIRGNAMADGKRGPQRRSKLSGELKEKDLMLAPHRLAIALQDSGWWVRSDIIWSKKTPMPEAVRDRPTQAHEHIFMMTKSEKYFYDPVAVAEPATSTKPAGNGYNHMESLTGGGGINPEPWHLSETRNLRNVWHLGPEAFPDAHFATFPTEIPRRCIKAGTSEHGVCDVCGAPWIRQTRKVETGQMQRVGKSWDTSVDGGGHRTIHEMGRRQTQEYRPVTRVETVGWEPSCKCALGLVTPATVLDPFLGSGTTVLVADQLGRCGVGIELNPDYAAMAERRIVGDAPMFTTVEVIRS